ncbi:MAG: isoprenylcysteine carboxyl methyltransferase [Parachlamydiales bacterium]
MAKSSSINAWVITGCLAAFVVTLVLLKVLGANDPVLAAILLITVPAAVNFALDLILEKVHLRPSTGLDWKKRNYSLKRSAIKYVGFAGTVGVVLFLYWLFPEYSDPFYHGFRRLLYLALPVVFVIAGPYIYFVDARMKEPLDSYYEVGRIILEGPEKIKVAVLKQHALAWAVKAFFIPLMFVYFVNDLNVFFLFDFSSITSFHAFFNRFQEMAFLFDVGFGTMGYIMSLRLFDTHVRSAEPTMTGWISALICYQPFFSIFGRYYSNYQTGHDWTVWFGNYPVLLYIWGTLIMALYLIYAWATIIFGCRFSNLTHRGIITNGPSAFLKHPAFVSKNLSWWLVSLPMLSAAGPMDAFKRCLMLLIINAIYFLRAKTEERHLSFDKDYVEYSNHIDKRDTKIWKRFKFLYEGAANEFQRKTSDLFLFGLLKRSAISKRSSGKN